MFCPKCGSILMPSKDGAVCKCGYSDKKEVKLEEKAKNKKGQIEIASEDDKLPILKAECPKCANNDAYYWLVQTRAGDEPETKFLKCTNCKHIWRDYS